MTLEEVLGLWETDAEMDRSEIGHESLNIPKLHHKYLRLLKTEAMKRYDLEAEAKSLRHRKLDFYTNGHNDESRRLGWQQPARGRVLKTEAAGYLDSDPEVLELGRRVAYQVEVVDALERIVKQINGRNYELRVALDFLKFQNGSN